MIEAKGQTMLRHPGAKLGPLGMIKDYERQALLGKSLENIVAGVAVGHTCSGEALRVLPTRLIQALKSEQRRLSKC